MNTPAIHELRTLLDPQGLLEPEMGLGRYEHAPNLDSGVAAFVARPADADTVSALLDWAYRHRIRLIPQGANSGLVAAGLPDDSGRYGILSTERLRERFDLDTSSRTLIVSAGWQLDEINERLAKHGLQLPIEVGSNPAAGGMVGTNTAGSHLLRYGDVRRSVLGLRAAIPDGQSTVLDLLRPLRKQNQGLDLKQVFIGTAGTFGVVTEVAFELARLPSSRAAAWLAVHETNLLDLLVALETHCGTTLSAFEVVSPAAAALLCARHKNLLNRVPEGEHCLALVEIGANDERAQDILTTALAEVAERNLMIDARVGRCEHMWEVRHAIPEITEQMAPVLSFDLATPRSGIARFLEDMRSRLAVSYPDIAPIELGHYGDGGIHLILPLPERIAANRTAVDELRMFVYDLTMLEHDGSFSAEHGIGPKNYDAYQRYTPEPERAISELLKTHFDPRAVLGSVSWG